MLVNRSIPETTIIPELAYADLHAAVGWLCAAFGFSERLRIADHRVQLVLGAGALVAVQREGGSADGARAGRDHSIMVRVPDVDAHCAQAGWMGAEITRPPTDYPYGERQYSVLDLDGHAWTFTQTIADSDPASWGGVLVQDTGSP
jgi:uncharacterized glyoxalase superfamily protein PhnB